MSDGFYYLHENGDLIWRRFEPEQDPGGFVKHVWRVVQDRAVAWKIVVEAAALGARPERIEALKAKWGLTNEDGREFCARNQFLLAHVGGLFYVKLSKTSPAAKQFKEIRGQGSSVFDALVNYVRQYLEQGGAI